MTVVDSIEFGCEDVNSFITEKIHLSAAELGKEIRLRGASVYRDPVLLGGNDANVRQVRNVIEQFANGLIEIVARFVAAEISQTSPPENNLFGFIMFGSGWKTIFHTPDREQIQTEAANRVSSRLEEYRQAGIIAYVPQVACRYPEDPKMVVARGAANFRAGNFEFGASEGQTFAMEDLQVLVGGGEEQIAWNTALPRAFSSFVAALRLSSNPQIRI